MSKPKQKHHEETITAPIDGYPIWVTSKELSDMLKGMVLYTTNWNLKTSSEHVPIFELGKPLINYVYGTGTRTIQISLEGIY